MHIALLPLDERPANTRYPAQVAAIAGATLELPPAPALPDLRRRADQAALIEWLRAVAPRADGIVASIDLLGYGGLIASRTTDDDVLDVLRAVAPLTELRTPERPAFAFNVIQRISNANDATEEPDYWTEYGTRLYRWSREADLALQGSDRSERSDPSIPADILRDWLARRARNHAVNLAMLREAALGKFDLLVIPSDDTSPIGLSARERKHLEAWKELLFSLTPGPSPNGRGEVLMYPGADDLGSAMVARMINHKRGHAPRVCAHYADDAMRGNVAPYEDRPIQTAVATQIMAVGAQQVDAAEAADVILAVSPPFERRADRDPHWADPDPDLRRAVLLPFVQQIARWVDSGRRVAIADVAFPNGAEPALVELLLEHADVARLAAFGGWNTAGNTLGSVLGSACVPQEDDRARQVALAHHLLEDWGYQAIVRNDLRSWLSETFGEPRIPPGHLPEATAFTAAWLEPLAERIRRAGLPCALNGVRHPWRRTFEVDFEVSGE